MNFGFLRRGRTGKGMDVCALGRTALRESSSPTRVEEDEDGEVDF